jgi:hypothetical protein
VATPPELPPRALVVGLRDAICLAVPLKVFLDFLQVFALRSLVARHLTATASPLAHGTSICPKVSLTADEAGRVTPVTLRERI